MNAARERNVIRTLHLLLSVPILGYVYGPVAQDPSGGVVHTIYCRACGYTQRVLALVEAAGAAVA